MNFVGRTLADDTRSLRPTWRNTCPEESLQTTRVRFGDTTQPVAEMPLPEVIMKQQTVVQFQHFSNSYFGL